jgi:hypothetical protein
MISFSAGWIIVYICCVCIGIIGGTYRPSEHNARFREWVLRVTEPWREEHASLDLEWRTFARKHNTGGNRPYCAYEGWEDELNEDDKAEVYEFPDGDPAAPPDCLSEAHRKAAEEVVEQARVSAGLQYRPGKVPS